MTIRFAKSFVKDYKKLPDAKRKKVDKAIRQLKTDRQHPALNIRKMVGVEKWEVRIDYHYRMTFRMYSGVVELSRVGTHEIYRKP